jgi:hypothetical protein
VGAAVLELPAGTPVTIVGRLQAREWHTRIYLELVAETVTVDVAVGPGEPAASAERPVPRAAPRASRPMRTERPDPPGRDRVPF